jgi:hypothetical protein
MNYRLNDQNIRNLSGSDFHELGNHTSTGTVVRSLYINGSSGGMRTRSIDDRRRRTPGKICNDRHGEPCQTGISADAGISADDR